MWILSRIYRAIAVGVVIVGGTMLRWSRFGYWFEDAARGLRLMVHQIKGIFHFQNLFGVQR
ncbi:hypothetical protein [Oscillatoria salina]|uniref:hypothetical protein n=1 Tax=Oscillatoria salina TaxID=331517 RepID=UPI001CCD0AB6|nr:hypothetical protein [Oscillatoria salina]MBZ8178627.1 hypothetical protein [Oscillatoria salina IIICB1]